MPYPADKVIRPLNNWANAPALRPVSFLFSSTINRFSGVRILDVTLLRQDGGNAKNLQKAISTLRGYHGHLPHHDSLQFKDVTFSCFICANMLLKSNSTYLRKAFHGVPEVFDVYVCFFNPSDVSCVSLTKRQRRKRTLVRFMPVQKQSDK